MVKSLGDYNKEQSSSSDVKNIKWTQKDPVDQDKPKKKRKRKISATNIISNKKNKKTENKVEKIFKIEDNDDGKNKNKPLNRKFEKSSISNSKIEQGYKRPAR